jgi:hypothetical protein
LSARDERCLEGTGGRVERSRKYNSGCELNSRPAGLCPQPGLELVEYRHSANGAKKMERLTGRRGDDESLGASSLARIVADATVSK